MGATGAYGRAYAGLSIAAVPVATPKCVATGRITGSIRRSEKLQRKSRLAAARGMQRAFSAAP